TRGGIGHHRQRAVSRAAHLREPRLFGLSSPDAALCVPALGGHRYGGRRPAARLGEAEPAARIPDAAGRRAADRTSDDVAVISPTVTRQGRHVMHFAPARCSAAKLLGRFLADESGATAIEY